MRRLGKREIQTLRERLLAAERALLHEIETHEGDRRAVAEAIETEEDRGQDAPLGTRLESLEERERGELTEVLRALGRIEQGTYGTCEECGEAIPLARLRVVPAAVNCVNCHAAAERAGKRR